MRRIRSEIFVVFKSIVVLFKSESVGARLGEAGRLLGEEPAAQTPTRMTA